MKVKSESEVAQSCPTLSDPMDCSLPGSSIHGIFQARVLEWGAIAFSVTKFREPVKRGKDFSTFTESMSHCINHAVITLVGIMRHVLVFLFKLANNKVGFSVC